MSRYPKIHGLLSSGSGLESYNFGMLYNWYAANTSILVPSSWNIPSSTEWATLKTTTETLWGVGTAGRRLKSGSDWLTSIVYGDNYTLFTGKPSGIRYDNGGYYLARGSAFYWANNQYDINNGYYTRLDFNSDDFGNGTYSKKIGMSIRCIRNSSGTYVYDKDGNNYETVIIGNQEWMTTNLKTTKYADGSSITYNNNWTDATINNADGCGSYNGDNGYVTDYGRLYNYYVVNGSNGDITYLERDNIREGGWRIPSQDDFTNLSNYLTSVAPSGNVGGKLKETGTSHWTTPNTNATNTSGWYGRGGARYASSTPVGDDATLNAHGHWWTTTAPTSSPITMRLNYDNGNMDILGVYVYYDGLSIRLMRDVGDIKMIDGDGNYYNTIKIGDQIWTQENLRTTTNVTGSSIAYVTNNTTWNTTSIASRCAYNNNVKNV